MEERILVLLEGLIAKMDGLSAQVERLESRLDTLAAQLHQRIDALEQTLIGEFHSVDVDRDDLKRRVGQLELDVQVLKKVVAG